MTQTIISLTDFKHTSLYLKDKFDKLDDSGCFFAICSTEYDSHGNVVYDFLDIIDIAKDIGYTYVNTIVYPTKQRQHVCFCDNVRYVVWLCKDLQKMRFNKDAIREKHIWKDIEWGKRSKNYNPKGKDPGNVWIPTCDDGQAHITSHLLLSDDEVIARIKSASGCKDNCEVYLSNIPTVNFQTNYANEQAAGGNQTTGKVIFGTSENMCKISDESVSLIVTSPPYWNLKDYFKEGQIGQESYSTYLNRMKSVLNECYRSLKKSGSLWLNINIRTANGNVLLIPKDIIKICKQIGFYYKGILIWHKSSGIPTGDKNLGCHHEYVLIFSKSENFSINIEKQRSFCDYKNTDINGGAFWNINRKAGSVGKKYIHPAIYPVELVRRIILLSTSESMLISDPFLGSGTSLIAALQLNRNFIGYEYNENFKSLMESRFKAELPRETIIRFE